LKIISYWIPENTKKKLKFIGRGMFDLGFETLFDYFDHSQIPEEWGGTNTTISLKNDHFMAVSNEINKQKLETLKDIYGPAETSYKKLKESGIIM